VGVGRDDGEDASRWLAEKTAHLRIFPDGEGKLNRSLLEVQGDALVVSQFTLYGDVRKGRRPSFVEAAAPETAERLYLQVAKELESIGVTNVETGTFQTHMVLSLENDGPVTILLESPPR
jgi:D-tyrosyl-tRNA(Tyr) deacylase